MKSIFNSQKSTFLVMGIMLSFLLISCGGKKTVEKPEEPATAVLVQTAKKGSLTQYLQLTGELKAENEVDIYPDVEGKVKQIVKYEGQSIRKDSPILYIDRYQVGANYALAPLRSPISGIVTRLYIVEGENVALGSPLASVGQVGRMEVFIRVPEDKVSTVKVGSYVNIRSIAYPGKEFQAKVYRQELAIDPNNRTLLIRAWLDNSEKLFYSGMFVDADVFVQKIDDTFVFPSSAVFTIQTTTDDQPHDYIYVNDNGIARLQEVKIELSYVDQVAIAEGVKEGDEVVVFGREYLTDGVRIQPMNVENDSSEENSSEEKTSDNKVDQQDTNELKDAQK